MTLGVCSPHAEKQDSEIVELAEAGPHTASHAGCEQRSYVPKAWQLHIVHALSSLLCAPCCCQSTWGAVGPPAQPGSTASEGMNSWKQNGTLLCGWSSAPHWAFSATGFADSPSLSRSQNRRNVFARPSGDVVQPPACSRTGTSARVSRGFV